MIYGRSQSAIAKATVEATTEPCICDTANEIIGTRIEG